jgi:ABC-type polysaccharide/polyol phosphate export permease
VSVAVQDCAYFVQLFKLFEFLERAQKIPELRLLAEILRAVFLLNEPNIIEFLVIVSATCLFVWLVGWLVH